MKRVVFALALSCWFALGLWAQSAAPAPSPSGAALSNVASRRGKRHQHRRPHRVARRHHPHRHAA